MDGFQGPRAERERQRERMAGFRGRVSGPKAFQFLSGNIIFIVKRLKSFFHALAPFRSALSPRHGYRTASDPVAGRILSSSYVRQAWSRYRRAVHMPPGAGDRDRSIIIVFAFFASLAQPRTDEDSPVPTAGAVPTELHSPRCTAILRHRLVTALHRCNARLRSIRPSGIMVSASQKLKHGSP
ncbi:hypothetical protein P280DRAFT_191384 [Massarina eburnea CBS 473.64]|uniref:Uncharacterized protein n=1 Tax=Massarina eburnea CBS 473.64 TaxID=1395130 RepID=A0A6A6RJY3_9PLEO|nr:hypothetical protein P280DRAFT_191384 [Massarina eburnea CBS 473.64]